MTESRRTRPHSLSTNASPRLQECGERSEDGSLPGRRILDWPSVWTADDQMLVGRCG